MKPTVNLLALFLGAILFTSVSAPAARAQQLTIGDAAEYVFDLAVELYPELFTTGVALRETRGYRYRFYPQSGIYIGFRDDRIYLVGGIFGTRIIDRGSVAEVTALLEAVKTKRTVGGNSGLGGGFGIAATINGSLQAFTRHTSYIETRGFKIGTVAIPDAVTLISGRDQAESGSCQQCGFSWSLTLPHATGTHACQNAVSGLPGAVSLTLDNTAYTTAGNGFNTPQCSITVTSLTSSAIAGTFSATLVYVNPETGDNELFARITDGEFNIAR